MYTFLAVFHTEVCLTVSATIVDISKWESAFLWQLYLHHWEVLLFLNLYWGRGIEGICVPSRAILSCLAAQSRYHLHVHCWFNVHRCALVFVFLLEVGHRQMNNSNGKSNKPRRKQRTGNILIVHYGVMIKIVIKIIFSSRNNQGFKYRKSKCLCLPYQITSKRIFMANYLWYWFFNFCLVAITRKWQFKCTFWSFWVFFRKKIAIVW